MNDSEYRQQQAVDQPRGTRRSEQKPTDQPTTEVECVCGGNGLWVDETVKPHQAYICWKHIKRRNEEKST